MKRNGSKILILAALLVIGALSSCEKKTDPVPVMPNGDKVVSLENDVQPIFDQNCISCHPNSGDLSLMAGDSYNNLVNIISPEYGVVRVSPFYADSSVICMKLHGVDGYGFLMPLNGIPLEAEEIKTIEDWIDQGAQNN
jgi:hypothetical protein